jgi:hypothetical protein
MNGGALVHRALPHGVEADTSLRQLGLGHADYTASYPRTGVAGRISFQIVLLSVNDDGSPDDRIFAAEFQLAFPLQMSLAGSISFNIAEIAGVTLRSGRPVVVLMCRIKMAASGCRIGRGAIAEFVDMKSVFTRCQTGHVRDHLNAIIGFRESDRARHLASRSWMQNGDRFLWLLRGCGENSDQKNYGRDE